MRSPTIWEALAAKLGREPTHREACDEVAHVDESTLIGGMVMSRFDWWLRRTLDMSRGEAAGWLLVCALLGTAVGCAVWAAGGGSCGMG
jgi:hypothetical protein